MLLKISLNYNQDKSSAIVTKRATLLLALLEQVLNGGRRIWWFRCIVDNNYQMLRNYDVSNDPASTVYAGAGTDCKDLYRRNFKKFAEYGGEILLMV